MPQVITADEFNEWYWALESDDMEAVTKAVDVLQAKGGALGFPRSSQIKGSRYPLRELRIQSGGHALRVFYAFDPQRDAVLILGGDKSGDNRFYETMVPKAEEIWEQYLAEQKAGLRFEEEDEHADEDS